MTQASGTRAELMSWLTRLFLSPLFWLILLQLCLLGGLSAVGYLSDLDSPAQLRKVLDALIAEADIAARRAALAYSGVTLGITIALALTSVVWASATVRGVGNAFSGGAPSSRNRIVIVAVLATACLVGAVWAMGERGGMHPFPSQIGKALLQLAQPCGKVDLEKGAGWVPMMMFLLAFIVPAVLATGAELLVSWQAPPSQPELLARLRELDHLLCIGALALVFGTLQLSAALSVPLASAPRTSEVKLRLEFCKEFRALPTPASPASSASDAAPEQSSRTPGATGLEDCATLPAALERSLTVDSVRQLVRSVTLALGLAFSVLLVGIYVPSLVRLKTRMEVGEDKAAELDPFRRLSTFAAALGPLVASLVANAFTGG